VTSFNNIDNVTIEGVETQIEYDPSRYSSIFFGYSYIDIENTTNGLYDYKTSAPKHNFSLLATHKWKTNVQTSLAYYWMDDMFFLGGVSDPLEQRDRLDLRIGTALQGTKHSGEVAFVIQNAFGNDYHEFNDVTIFETRAYITLELEYY
jgi:outer membrane receptor protein involved in Fe transport